jgi:hypothetical protein
VVYLKVTQIEDFEEGDVVFLRTKFVTNEKDMMNSISNRDRRWIRKGITIKKSGRADKWKRDFKPRRGLIWTTAYLERWKTNNILMWRIVGNGGKIELAGIVGKEKDDV